jgi:hypothetical protein
VSPPSFGNEYMNLLIVSTNKPPASPISTSFHFSLPANTFYQPPRILTYVETTSMDDIQLQSLQTNLSRPD